ncbi:iron uptake transporter deferrochelatase/peroxidase subunit [Poseidonocella sp. HB161398]|uniref:iron uptake transporter deferrochelatase/peroxidase subunit n=1 Tax=Poseidonocella sp. HB161398 TaxID=2320855 RepID=UPI0011091B65|nr:iron uptake transporter deferrochelatase/peroxidase subunit [Poseidonocella sp. HB161398]
MSKADHGGRGCPFGPSRRSVLLGLGAGGIGAMAAQAGTAAAPQVNDAPDASAEAAARRVPYLGRHQAGIVTPRPEAGLVAAFDVVAFSPDEVERMLKTLTERIAFLTQGGEVPGRDPRLPPADSGMLGPVVSPDSLTVTVGLGRSFFDGRDWLSGLAPVHLARMAEFPNDALDPAMCHGDLSIQFCAGLPDTNIHALRDIVKSLSEFLVLRWTMEGSVPPVVPAPSGETQSARNFLGFRDGSANPDSNDAAAMDRLVWTHAAGEPGWAQGGSYQAVRLIRNFVERWDRSALAEQEAIFGRRKVSGAPLDGGEAATERDVPDYAADPDGLATPLDSHIRRANPRSKGSEANLILRRPFNYSRGVSANGQLDQGLLFICYQADLEAGFITVQTRLNGEPLEEYLKPFGGGYFFVLPGIRDAGDHLGATLLDAVRHA